MNRTAMGMPIWVGLISLALAATGQAQIVGVRPSPARSSGVVQPAPALTDGGSEPNTEGTSFQAPSVEGPVILSAARLAPPAAAQPSTPSPSVPLPSAGEAAPTPAGGEPSIGMPPPPFGTPEPIATSRMPFDVGNGAWGEPSPVAPTDWNAVMAPALAGPPPTIVNPPGTYEPYTPAGGGFLGGGFLRMLFFGNGIGPAIQSSGSQQLFGGWKDWAPPVADRGPCYGLYLFESYEGWRSIPDGNTRPHGNNGATQGLNLAAPIPWLEQYGFGGQLGLSYGAFGAQADAQQQVFVTTGIFRRADFNRPISFGLVYDQMLNSGFGAYRQSPALGQLRIQVAYAFSARDEVGFEGALRLNSSVRGVPGGGTVEYRGISQGQLFWHHKWGPGKTDTWVWTGVPSAYRLNGDNSFETNIYGYRSETPLTDRVGLFSTFQGLRPTGGVSHHSIYDFMVGMSFYPARNARSTTVAGRSWMPYMPVANNSSFLVDSNRTF
jgi:hypothetical protein